MGRSNRSEERQAARSPEAAQKVDPNAVPLAVRETGVEPPADAVVIDASTGNTHTAPQVLSQNHLAGVLETPAVRAARIEGEKAAYQEPQSTTDDGVMIVCTIGTFVLKAPTFRAGTTEIDDPGVTLNFADGRVVVTDGEEKLVEDALAGKLGAVKQQEATRYGLQVVKKGKLAPPMPTWDTLASNVVLNIAQAAGVLQNLHSIQHALDYEKQKPTGDKAKPGEPAQRADVIAVLQGYVDTGLDHPLENPALPSDAITFALT